VFTKSYIKRLIIVSFIGVALALGMYVALAFVGWHAYFAERYEIPLAHDYRMDVSSVNPVRVQDLGNRAVQLAVEGLLLDRGLGVIGIGLLVSWGSEYLYKRWRTATNK
jgi:hypothetical protein